MTKSELENIKRNKRWTVTLEDFYSRYIFILFPLGIFFLGSLMTMIALRNNKTDFKIVAITIVTLGLFSTLFVLRRLYQNQAFKSYQVKDISKDKIEFALNESNLDNVKFNKLGYYTATTNFSWFSWGEQITVIINDNELLINSRPKGSSFSFQPITIFKDRQNIKTIIDKLQLDEPNE